MKRQLKLVHQLEPRCVKPYRIIEVQATVDGPRDRITDHCFARIDEALNAMKELEARDE